MTKIEKLFKTILTIIKSRFKKESEESERIKNKRNICKTCPFNSLNMEKIPLKKRILKQLSDFYSYITGNSEVDVLGNCNACEACSVYYKTENEDECPKDKW